MALSLLVVLPLLWSGPNPTAPRVEDGIESEPCEWPNVVSLFSEDEEQCTGTYIGGRVILTAAHCMSAGYRVLAPPGGCDADADCPDADVWGDPVELECPDEGSSVCLHPDPTRSNDHLFAYFGERYAASDGHPRRAIPISYCKRFNEEPEEGLGTGEDIAYCILRERTNIRPVPIIMHCEVDQFLTAGTEVRAIGFGQNAPGIKRWGSSTLLSASNSDHLEIAGFGDWVPGPPRAGDSGGPLMAQLPDGTWRQIGIAETSLPSYTTPWPKVEWMLEDPNIQAQDIIPCHTPNGQWDPTAECGGFPLEPETPDGAWARGPEACYDPAISGLSETCGEPFSGAAIGDGGGGGGGNVGCHVSPTNVGFLSLGLLVIFSAFRRRKEGAA